MLYLDDLRSTPEGFERVYSYTEFGGLLFRPPATFT